MIFRKQINKEVRKRMGEFFNGYNKSEVTYVDIDNFVMGINDYLQSIAHEILDDKGFMAHLDRRAIKDATRLKILQDLAQYYPSQVVEYLWLLNKEKIESQLFINDEEGESKLS